MTNQDKLREEAHSVHSLILKDVLTPHQVFVWVEMKIEEAISQQRQELREAIEELLIYLVGSHPLDPLKNIDHVVNKADVLKLLEDNEQ